MIIFTCISYLLVKQVKETFIWTTPIGNILTLKSSQILLKVTKLPPLKMPSYILIPAGLTKQFKIKGVLLSGQGCAKGIFKVTLYWICFRLVLICFSTLSLGICTI